MKNNYNHLKMDIAAVQHRINQGRQTLATGIDIDLSGLNDQVQKVCESIESNYYKTITPKNERESLAQDLSRIIIDLDELKKEVTQRHAILGGKKTSQYTEDD